MAKGINISRMADEIRNALSDYAYVASEVVNEAIEKTAKETAEELRKTSPQRTGEYAKSWDYGYKKRKGSKFSLTVFSNAPEYRLTHLLEKPHALRNGGRSKPIPHIAPAQEKAKEWLIDNIKEGLK